jgi:small-conductance mechanosensitive channel
MEHTDDEHRGRVMGVYMMNFGLIPLGVLPIGALADVIGVGSSFAIAGAALAAVAIAFALVTKRLREL